MPVLVDPFDGFDLGWRAILVNADNLLIVSDDPRFHRRHESRLPGHGTRVDGGQSQRFDQAIRGGIGTNQSRNGRPAASRARVCSRSSATPGEASTRRGFTARTGFPTSAPIFTASSITQSTSLASIVQTIAHQEFAILPSLAVAGVAFTMVSLAENARVPVDNPATHLELTMIHEAMILEYSGRHLALIEWAASLKLFAYSCIGVALFVTWGIAAVDDPIGILLAAPSLIIKLIIGGAALALIETLSAKMRIFRVPEFLAGAFLLAVIGILVRFLLKA